MEGFARLNWPNATEDIWRAVSIKNSQPNSIAGTFLNDLSGVINGTYSVLPIDSEVARSIIPKKYGILFAGIRSFLPFSFETNSR